MHQQALYTLTLIILLGVAAQWLAWSTRLPSILLLLLAGFVAGPVTGVIQPDLLFGDLLLPVISIAVALILFEGGLSLNLREIRGVGGVVTLLVTVGVIITWILATLAGRALIGLTWELSALLGAILTVTGPTVVLPLLRHIKPASPVGSILKWEGIVIDPIGALLAVLVFEVMLGEMSSQTTHVATALVKTAGGGMIGFVGAMGLVVCLRQYWVPDHLQTAVATMLVVAALVAANALQQESGLLAVTVMGITLANQRMADIRHILEFKENLRVFLLSVVFILLSARVRLADLASIGASTLLFVSVLILIIRPVSVFMATVGSKLTLRQRMFVGGVAPRGIVAAAVTSVFALSLEEAGDASARLLVPIVFATIVGTVLVYGLLGKPLARRLELSEAGAQGVLFVGAGRVARQIAGVLQSLEFRVLMVDTNRTDVVSAQMEGIPASHGNILSEDIEERVDLTGLGMLFAMTANDEVNVLAVERFARNFGREHVYQLAPKGMEKGKAGAVGHLRGRALFNLDASSIRLFEAALSGATVKATRLTKVFDYPAFLQEHGDSVLPLLVVTEKRRLLPMVAGEQLTPKPDQTVVALIPPKQQDASPGP